MSTARLDVSGREADLHVDDGGFPDVPVSLLVGAIRRALGTERGEAVEISLALLPDEEMRRLSRRFLGKDRTTDVLAFALSEGGGPTVGDIYLGYEQALRQAEDLGVPLREELARLAIHGTLHVLGHDHPEGPDRADSPMFRLQERLLGELLEDGKHS